MFLFWIKNSLEFSSILRFLIMLSISSLFNFCNAKCINVPFSAAVIFLFLIFEINLLSSVSNSTFFVDISSKIVISLFSKFSSTFFNAVTDVLLGVSVSYSYCHFNNSSMCLYFSALISYFPIFFNCSFSLSSSSSFWFKSLLFIKFTFKFKDVYFFTSSIQSKYLLYFEINIGLIFSAFSFPLYFLSSISFLL